MSFKAKTRCSRPVRWLLLTCLVALSALAAGAARAEDPAGRPSSIRVVADDNYPAYLFRDDNGHAQGYLVDYWKLWAQKTGVEVVFKPMVWSMAQETIQAGKADVIDTIFDTEPRRKIYDFTRPYADLPVNIYTSNAISGITDTQTLQGFLVGVMSGDACIDILAERGITYLRQYTSYRNLILAAARGEVKVFCLDEAPANFYFYKLNLGGKFKKAFQLYVGQFHRAVLKGNTAMLDLVQHGMGLITPGEDAELRKKWFGTPVDLRYVDVKYYGIQVSIFLLAAAALSGILLLWNVMLRYRVSLRTADLEKTLVDLRQAQDVADDYRKTLEQRVMVRTRELNRAAESLRLSNDELNAVFDAATVGIALINGEAIQSCNTTMEQMFGYRQDELIGKPARVLYTDDAAYAAATQRLALDMVANGSYRTESELVRKDGTRFWCRIMVQPISSQSLDEGFAATFEDISIEQEAMAEIEKARKLAEDAAAIKASFLANMSHEIRTPMNAIIGMTHLALKSDPPPKLADYLRKIDRSSKHLLGIINDILDFSKVEAGKMVIESTAFDLRALIDNVSGLVADGISEKRLKLVSDIGSDVPAALVGDPLRISQILINYLNNAVKFTEAGQIVISVRIEERQGDSLVLRFSVKDTGVGLTSEQQKKLFASFQQGDASTTRKFGGTGLGLAISKRLAELMGGHVGVDSIPGVGSTFWFTVPLQKSAVEVAPIADAVPLVAGRILVVDDDEAAREVERSMLEEMGYSVVAVPSGHEALVELQRGHDAGQSYDLVLLDWKMPGMDGVATATRIRDIPLPKLPLILMVTAYDPQELRQSAPGIGHLEVLVKPVSKGALAAMLSRLLGVALRAPAGSGPVPAQASADVRGARVLLVEDNALNQEVAREILQEFGLLVDVADNGVQAIAKLETGHYDAVFMDVQMPVMDGIQATQKIRQDPRFGSLPIIAMTASVMEEDQKKCLAAGMNGHVAKPIDPDSLLRTLKNWVRPAATGGGQRPAAPAAGARQREADIPPALSQLPGLDAAQGLRRTNGKTALYLSLLRKFVASQGRVPEEVGKAIAVGQREEALRLVHTLKGVSGNIGATEVMAAAAALEASMGNGGNAATFAPALAGLKLRLDALVSAISAAAGPEAAAVASPADAGKLDEVCKRLRQLLANGDAEASDVLAGNAECLAGAFPLEFPMIEDCIRNFDYEAALSALERALAGRAA